MGHGGGDGAERWWCCHCRGCGYKTLCGGKGGRYIGSVLLVCQTRMAAWRAGGGKPPVLLGAFPGHTRPPAAAGCHGFVLVSDTIPLLSLSALCAELQQNTSLL